MWAGSPPFPQTRFHQLYSKPFILKLNPHGPALSIWAYCMGMWLIPKPLTFSDLYCCQDTLYSFSNCSALQKKMSTVGFFCLNYHATGISFIMQTFSYFFFWGNKPRPVPSPEEFQYEKQSWEAREGVGDLSAICKPMKIMLFLLGQTLRGKCELSINT